MNFEGILHLIIKFNGCRYGIPYLQAPSKQLNLSSPLSFTGNIPRKKKQLRVPDLWPQESIPEKWEDREDSSTLVPFFRIRIFDL